MTQDETPEHIQAAQELLQTFLDEGQDPTALVTLAAVELRESQVAAYVDLFPDADPNVVRKLNDLAASHRVIYERQQGL